MLPTKVDPLVSLMKVEKVPDATYDMVGGLEKQIQELPTMKVQGSNAKEELETKKKRAQTLNMQKLDLEEDIRALKGKFDKLRADREAVDVRMVPRKRGSGALLVFFSHQKIWFLI